LKPVPPRASSISNGGNDDNSGADKTAAWKHHPWDPNAAGKAKACRGIFTYVFKRGVVYRGELAASESGDAKSLIRLTSDPQWRDPKGPEDAVISGAERVTGWTKDATNKSIPDGDKVWSVELAYSPRNVFEYRNGKIERLNLARTPNWKVSDPERRDERMVELGTAGAVGGQVQTQVAGHAAHLGIDKKHLTQPADYYLGANVRSEFGFVMGTPYPTTVEAFDATKKPSRSRVSGSARQSTF